MALLEPCSALPRRFIYIIPVPKALAEKLTQIKADYIKVTNILGILCNDSKDKYSTTVTVLCIQARLLFLRHRFRIDIVLY
jgi:hypothetical protein